jgi:probable rRNA maturation factor
MNNKLSLVVQYASDVHNLPTRAQFRRWFKVALQRNAEITLRIVDEPEGRELNENFRGKNKATNVLTFVYEEVQPQHGVVEPSDKATDMASSSISNVSQPHPLSGDIVICAPVVKREAAAQHKDLLAHYAHLTIHAALHLQGYEHGDDADTIEMEALETALMVKLHYPDPYQI